MSMGLTTKEALREFFARSTSEDERAMTAFCQINRQRIRDWRSGSYYPKGTPLIRLMVFLDLKGYEQVEFNDMRPYSKKLAFLLALDIVVVEDLVGELDYASAKPILAFVLRGRSLYNAQNYKLEKIIDQKSDLAGLAIDDARNRFEHYCVAEVIKSPAAEISPAVGHFDPGLLEQAIEGSIRTLSALLRELELHPDRDIVMSGVAIKLGDKTDYVLSTLKFGF